MATKKKIEVKKVVAKVAVKSVTKKPEAKTEAKKMEKTPKVAVETFADHSRELLNEQNRTDQEMAEILEKKFPETPDVLGALRWHRWKYNTILDAGNGKKIPVYIRDEDGKIVKKSHEKPVQKVEKVKAKAEVKPAVQTLAKPEVKKVVTPIVKKVIVKATTKVV